MNERGELRRSQSRASYLNLICHVVLQDSMKNMNQNTVVLAGKLTSVASRHRPQV